MNDKSPIRLAMVLGGHWSVQMGGAQFQAKCIVEALTRRGGFDISYLARVVPEQLQQPDHRIVPFGQRHAPGALLRQLPSLYQALRQVKPDVVYQRCLMPYTGAAALYCRHHGIPLVFHIASDDDVRRPGPMSLTPGGLWRYVSRYVSEFGLRRAATIVAQSQDQVRTLSREYGLTPSLVVRNFHPDAAERSEVGSRERLRILWVANLKPVKRPDLFVDLAEMLRGRCRAEFVMIGRPGLAGQYDALINRIDRLDNITFLGELSVDRVNRELANCDLLVNTSRAEGFPNTYVQAWLRAVPAVSTTIDPDQSLSQAGAGLLLQSIEDVASAIMRLDRDRSALQNLSRRALAYGIEHHTMKQADLLLEELIRQANGFGATSPSRWT